LVLKLEKRQYRLLKREHKACYWYALDSDIAMQFDENLEWDKREGSVLLMDNEAKRHGLA